MANSGSPDLDPTEIDLISHMFPEPAGSADLAEQPWDIDAAIPDQVKHDIVLGSGLDQHQKATTAARAMAEVCAGGFFGSVLGGIFTGGAGPAIGSGIGAAIPSLTERAKVIAERLVPDPVQQAAVQREIEAGLAQREAALVAAIQTQNSEQATINLVEAGKEGWFQSSWRPSVAWVCVVALAYQYLFAPLLTWFGAILGVALDIAFPAPPTLQVAELMPLLLGLLGLGGLRTVERVQGVSAPSAAAHNPNIPRAR